MTEKPTQTESPTVGHDIPRGYARVALGLIAVLTIVVWMPLARHYFSQDDWMLIYWAQNEPGRVLSDMFGRVPHYFRPLTVTGYFAGMSSLFGLRPFPYHIVSIALHVANTLLVFALMRRLRRSHGASLIVATLFGVNVAFFHAVGWITCVQQLCGAFFSLASMLLFFDAVRDASRRKIAASAAAYALALSSVERPFLIPFVMLASALYGLTDSTMPASKRAKYLWPHFALFTIYMLHRFVWKGGASAESLHFGTNIFLNLSTYLGGIYRFWPTIIDRIREGGSHVMPSHIALNAIVLWLLLKKRAGLVVFGGSLVLLTLLPSLPLTDHAYYYHLYLTSVGALLLLAVAIDDAFTVMVRWRVPRWAPTVLVGAAVVLFGVLSYNKVRWNNRMASDPLTWENASFVVRRAVISRTGMETLQRRRSLYEGARSVRMIHGWPGKESLGGWHRGVWWAWGTGMAMPYFLGSDIEVIFEKTLMPADQWLGWNAPDSPVIVYDTTGYCRMLSEVLPPSRSGE